MSTDEIGTWVRDMAGNIDVGDGGVTLTVRIGGRTVDVTVNVR